MRSAPYGTVAAAVALVAAALAAPADAQADITPVAAGQEGLLRDAIVSSPALAPAAAFAAGGVFPATATAVVSLPQLTGFPQQDEQAALLTTGDPTLADDPTATTASVNHGATARGAFDATVLRVGLVAPPASTCLAFTYRFLSEEGAAGNDGFVAELDTDDWTVTGTTISAPHDFSAGPQRMTPHATGALGLSAAFAAGAVYDRATDLLQAKTPITPGAHDLFLSIFDVGNGALDSAVLVDSLFFTAEGPATCAPPGTVPSSPPPSQPDPPAAPLALQPQPGGSPAQVSATKVPPDNRFRLAKVTHLKDGSVRLSIRVPRRGTLAAAFARTHKGQKSLVRSVRKAVARSGVYALRVRPSSAALQRMHGGKRVRALVRVKFTPTGGVPLTQVRRFTLGPRRG